jgi:hypothetical protein
MYKMEGGGSPTVFFRQAKNSSTVEHNGQENSHGTFSKTNTQFVLS